MGIQQGNTVNCHSNKEVDESFEVHYLFTPPKYSVSPPFAMNQYITIVTVPDRRAAFLEVSEVGNNTTKNEINTTKTPR